MRKKQMHISVGMILCIIVVLIILIVPKTKEKETKKKEVILTMMLPQTHCKEFFLELLEKFEKEHPGIQIELQVIPDNMWTEVAKTKVQVREVPDIIRIETPLLEEIGEEYFMEMTKEVSWYERVFPAQLESRILDGQLYGLPIESGSEIAVIYNREIFEQYALKIPQNIEEFREICVKLQENGIVPLYASDKDSWTVQLPFNAIAPMVVPDNKWEQLEKGEIKWSEVPEFEEILTEMRSLREDGFTNADYMNATYAGAADAIAKGVAAMYVIPGYFISDVQAINPEADLAGFPLPYNDRKLTMIEGKGQFSIFQDSRHKEEAKLFLEWFSKPENMDVFTKGWGSMPIFSDQNMEMNQYQEYLYEEYIKPEYTISSVQDKITGVDWKRFWELQQEVYDGSLSPKEALSMWDVEYEKQKEF